MPVHPCRAQAEAHGNHAKAGHQHHKRTHKKHHAKASRVSKDRKAHAAIAPSQRPVVAPVAAPSISGTTYYVSPNGSDSNSGTSPAQAWQTVGPVNHQVLKPGDGVLFQGGATFSDSDPEPAASGTAQAPIVYGSYGQGNATITHGVGFVQNYLIFDHLTFNATLLRRQRSPRHQQQRPHPDCDITLPAGNQQLGIYTNGNDWRILNNTIHNTGLSGIQPYGNNVQITGNTINTVGFHEAGYNAHGIYLDASNATITNNTITNTTAAGIYVSTDGDHALQQSVVIHANTIDPSTGVATNLKHTTGTYTVSANTTN